MNADFSVVIATLPDCWNGETIPRDYFHKLISVFARYTLGIFGERFARLGSFLLQPPSHGARRACTWLASTRGTCTHARPTKRLSVGLATNGGEEKREKYRETGRVFYSPCHGAPCNLSKYVSSMGVPRREEIMIFVEAAAEIMSKLVPFASRGLA